MKNNLTPIASAVALLVMSASAYAQQADTTKADDQKAQAAPQVQEVVVTGIRASLQSAVNIKRNSNSVVDAVSAEDIGKLPDNDVGETLGRIPGVSVGRAFGQGAAVSVRGSDPQMTYTTLNGQTIASTGWYDQQSIDRSFNYSLLPSELIGGIDVYKSSQADLTEGGIGGTVIVKTRKPLDMDANSGFITGSLAKGTVSTDPDKTLSGLYSWKNEAKTFGVLVSGAVDNGEYIRRGIESDTRWSQDVEPTTFVQDRKRTALNVDLQAKPIKGLDMDLNYLSLKLTGDNSNTSEYLFQNGGPGFNNCTSVNAAGVCTSSNTPTAATSSPSFVQSWVRQAQMTSDSWTLNAHYKGDGFKLEGSAGTTKANGGTSETTNYQYMNSPGNGVSLPTWTGNINATGNQIIVSPTSNQSFTTANIGPTLGAAGSWAVTQGPNMDKENFIKSDLTLDLDWNGITSFKTGFRYSQHTFMKDDFGGNYFAAGTPVATSSLYSGTIPLGTPGWTVPKPNIGAMIANTNANLSGWTEIRSGYGQLEEDNSALYGMFEFEKDKLRGNFGLRYVGTKATSTGYAFDGSVIPDALNPVVTQDPNYGWSTNKVTQTGSYNYLLPSLNAAYELDKQTVLRLAAARTMTRPNFDNMFQSSETGFSDKVPDQTMTYGSVALKPLLSTQFDLGLEYYYGKGNMASVTYFHKNIENFITSITSLNQKIGVVIPYSGKDSWQVNQYVNAGGGVIDGLELQVNHAFDNGFGVAANFTLTNATAPAASYADQVNVFTQSSKDNANFVAYWENPTYFARLAYNWRSKYMVRETGWYGNRWHDAYGQLDASAGWNITPKIRLAFEATNLLKADDIEYGVAGMPPAQKVPLQLSYPAWSFMGEAVYKITLSAKF